MSQSCVSIGIESYFSFEWFCSFTAFTFLCDGFETRTIRLVQISIHSEDSRSPGDVFKNVKIFLEIINIGVVFVFKE